MSRSFKALLSEIDGFRYRRQIEDAVALNLRGEVREDGLALSKVLSPLEVEWHARDIHPWDRDRLSGWCFDALSAAADQHLSCTSQNA